jgi:hypothetical protein
MTGEEYIEGLKKKYPLESIERHFSEIEKQGYTVVASEDQCQIYDGSILLIDSDFYDDYHSNAASALQTFYNE